MALEARTEARKSPLVRLLEKEHGRPIEELVGRLLSDGLTQKQVAERLSVDPSAISRWIDRYGITAATTTDG